jgi:very-short-patch-repair endonuclease
VNVRIGPYEVDFLWRAERVIVETDGAATHVTPQAFENDRHRDADLATLSYDVLRFTWRQVLSEPALVLRAVEAVLRG